MTGSLLHGGREELTRLFDEVAEEFSRSAITSEVLMVGGSWMLWFGLRDSTRDVDSARRLPTEAASAIAAVAGRRDLDPDWLNDSATAFLPFGFDSAPHPSVRTPDRNGYRPLNRRSMIGLFACLARDLLLEIGYSTSSSAPALRHPIERSGTRLCAPITLSIWRAPAHPTGVDRVRDCEPVGFAERPI